MTRLEKRAVSGSDKGGSDAARGSDKAKNHFPSLPARANQEAELVPTPRYGRGSDLEVILEVIGSADRLPEKIKAWRVFVSDMTSSFDWVTQHPQSPIASSRVALSTSFPLKSLFRC